MSEGMKRRDFLKVLGVGGATATAACSSGGPERLIPYVVPAEEIVPGVPTWYASTCRECPAGCGIHVETHSGRATKVEGNPENPISRGNLCARGQASVQGLYHPDRYQGPVVRRGAEGDTNVPWSTAERMVAEAVLEARERGQQVVLLSDAYTGTMARLADDFVRAIGARRVVYDPWAGQPRDLDFANADFVVSFGADFLETWGSPVDYAGQLATLRDHTQGGRGKFVWVGAHRPLTGLNADQWIAPKPGTEALVALAMAGRIDLASAAQQTEVPQATLEALASEFRSRRGVALGPGTAVTGAAAAQLRQAVAQLNGAAAPAPTDAGMADVLQLVEQMNAGQIGVLLIDANDPAYTLPGAVKFEEAMKHVPTRVTFTSFPDDTALLCTHVLPDHHFLEAWDDYVPRAGTVELVQPAMRPVFNTKQVGDVMLTVARLLGTENVTPGVAAATYFDYLRANWAATHGTSGDAWREAVKRGGLFAGAAAAAPTAAPSANGATPAAAAAAVATAPAAFAPVEFEATPDANFHLVVYPSYRFFDGRTANRPWLLELPDPVTKVPWDSFIELHPRAAESLGVAQGDHVEVTSPHGSVVGPVYVYPGVRDDTVAIQTGLGKKAFGRFNEGRGINPNVLLGATPEGTAGVRVTVKKTDTPSLYWTGVLRSPPKMFEQGVRVQYDRNLAQAVSVETLAAREAQGPGVIPGEDTVFAPLKGAGGFAPVPTTTDPAAYPPPGTHFGQYIERNTRWAMTIDLSRCIGCSACVIACNAENNVPVVGPDEMRKGRELHWLRIERYFGVTGDKSEAYADNATDDTRFLPMLCQHCGNAPCEPVCPVYAAYHTPDGLNAQVYNRCVGTRYCANNCPYKVRVFNWFSYEFPVPLNWQLNPDVTVRDKGVMEKCTFCVQRIHEAERGAAVERRTVRDGEVVPACVQTCPTEVFTFGNIQDPESAVAKAARSHRSYRALDELNVQPAIVYLQKVTLHEPKHGGDMAATAATPTGGTPEAAAPAGAH